MLFLQLNPDRWRLGFLSNPDGANFQTAEVPVVSVPCTETVRSTMPEWKVAGRPVMMVIVVRRKRMVSGEGNHLTSVSDGKPARADAEAQTPPPIGEVLMWVDIRTGIAVTERVAITHWR